jgi:cytochrome c peroxidase
MAGLFAFFWLPASWIPTTTPPVFFSQKELVEAALSFRVSHLNPSRPDPAKSSLGRRLFFDPRFSANQQIACASCHQPQRSFTDGRSVAQGLGQGQRNTPTLINIGFSQWFFWDGRSPSLAHQALKPLETLEEQGISRGRVSQLVARYHTAAYEAAFGPIPSAVNTWLSQSESPLHLAPPLPEDANSTLPMALASYGLATIGASKLQTDLIHQAENQGQLPQQWFGHWAVSNARSARPEHWTNGFSQVPPAIRQEIDRIFANVGRALASYQQQIVALDAPFDQFVAKLNRTRSPQAAFHAEFGPDEWRGFEVFLQSGCANCHNGPLFTDQEFHNIGLPARESLDLGRTVGLIRLQEDPMACRSEPNATACQELPYLDSSNRELMGAFKTPTLRNLEQTGPYMHDGRFRDLDAVLTHYQDPDITPAIGHRSESLRSVTFNSAERVALRRFLQALNSPVREGGVELGDAADGGQPATAH